MATHSTILAWRIPWTEEPGRLRFVTEATQHALNLKKSHIYENKARAVFLEECWVPTKEEIYLGASSLKCSSSAIFEVRGTVPS